MMAMGAVKSEPMDLHSLYDMEYRSEEDNAWYSVFVVFDSPAERLTVDYMCTPVVPPVSFTTTDFETERQVDELVQRFRPASVQLQDHECRSVAVDERVCAAYATTEVVLQYYDATIEAVSHKKHSVRDGEEVCLCSFVLCWQHGPGCGTLTSCSISDVCKIKSGCEMDPRISAFAKLVKDKIASSKSILFPKNLASESKNASSCKRKIFEMENRQVVQDPLWRSKEDPGRIGSYNQLNCEDEEIGSRSANIEGSPMVEDCYFIYIDNMERDLDPASIKRFIHKKTSILPQAFVFPRMLSDQFPRGVIMVDNKKDFQILCEFLENPNNLIVSSRGRPWVVTEKTESRTSRTIWNLNSTPLIDFNPKTGEELQIVHSGTDPFKRAKKLRDLQVEYMHHVSQVSKNLLLKEKRILQSSPLNGL